MLSQTGEFKLEHHDDRCDNKSLNHTNNKAKAKGTVSIVSLYKTIVQKEGMIGLWAGNGVNLLRVFPSKGIVFASNDYYRSLLRKYLVFDDSSALPTYLSFISGGMSGITASAATYPLDFVRGRISGKLKFASPKHASDIQYRGILQTIRVTVQHEGFFALYKGVTPTLIGAIPYEGIKFGTVGLCESMFPMEDSDKKQKVFRKLLFGGLGGAMAGLITYPNDTVRRLLQLQGSHGTTESFNGYWDCVRKTVSKHGVRRLYNGVGINLVRMVPNTAVQFGSYEFLKRITEDII